ncbi:hypothetical protein PT285_10775 [Lactobacillus sp. ESL0791]|uniref:hypothetical protein n=1 Tax=Lactobacillus sp. ESL0791 TaxID=2983234 RepID=UPI0023F81ABA|nr:hypothetical protein [Lactobacillus sp. ESL0791]MDF7639883.1 hypothetical protein [Lactobacillus sp. ESL0791]
MTILQKSRFLRALAAEWRKLWTLSLVWWTICSTLAANIVLTLAFANNAAREKVITLNILDVGLSPVSYIQAGFMILGILAICSEYNSGQIRATLAAMPWRRIQLFAKLLALLLLLIPFAFIIPGMGVLIVKLFYSSAVIKASSWAIIKKLLTVTAYLTLTALLTAGISILVRRTTSSLVGILTYYFIFGPILRKYIELAKYLPDAAGLAMWGSHHSGNMILTPALGSLSLIIWVIAILFVAVIKYQHYDA